MKKDKSKINKSKNIKIYNKLAKAKYAMNTSEQKLFLYAVRNIDQEAQEFPESKIDLLDFAEYADLEPTRLYKEINKMSTRLMQVIIHVEDEESKKKNKWVKYNLTKTCKYDNGVITFEFNDDMKPFLLGLQKHYFKQAPEIMGFSSWYSFRLYDLLKSQSYKSEEVAVEISWLKTILGVEDKYQNFSNFRRRVIEPAKNEVNEYSDIEIESYEKILKGNTITGISFKVKILDKNPVYSDVLVGMYDTEEFKRRIGLTPKALTDMQIIELYEIATVVFSNYRDMNDLYEYMRINYEYTRKHKPSGDPYYYFKKSLQEDWGKAISQIMTGYTIG